jgi:hypothetical protein
MSNVTQVHRRFAEQLAGAVLARCSAEVHWNDSHNRPVIQERRTVTVFRQPPPIALLLEFETQLKSAEGDVLLDGDPEHAGFQFRAHNDVAAKPVKDDSGKILSSPARYAFPADKVDLKKEMRLPWAAMTYTLRGNAYTVQHLNHPGNPPGRYSAYRPYGRFGHFARTEIKAGETLTLRYRICVTQGDAPPREELNARATAFAKPPNVAAKPLGR